MPAVDKVPGLHCAAPHAGSNLSNADSSRPFHWMVKSHFVPVAPLREWCGASFCEVLDITAADVELKARHQRPGEA